MGSEMEMGSEMDKDRDSNSYIINKLILYNIAHNVYNIASLTLAYINIYNQ